MSSDPGGNTGPNTGPAGMTGTTTVAGKTVKQYGTKKDAEQTRLKNFQQGAINKTKEAVNKAPVLAAKILSPIAVYGAGVNSKFFTDKVLTSSKAKKNIGYTQSEFAALTEKQQNKVYSDYMSKRMSGNVDAYGNQISTGGDRGGQTQTKTKAQIEAENVKAQKAAQAEADQAAAEQADAYKKKRLSITSSRSLFARPGGRGFFN
jgi:hypothetical protein